MKKIIFLSLLIFPVAAMASRIETGNQIYVIIPPPGGEPGQCLIPDGSTPPVYSWGDCSGSAPINYAIAEDDSFLLMEDDTKFLLER